MALTNLPGGFHFNVPSRAATSPFNLKTLVKIPGGIHPSAVRTKIKVPARLAQHYPGPAIGSSPYDYSSGQYIDPSTYGGAPLMDVAAAAQAAGIPFDQAIQMLMQQQAAQKLQAVQDQHDIEHWYGQVTDAQGVAAGRDTALTGAGVASDQAMTQAVLGSLGGSANEGAPLVAAAGANDTDTLRALGTVQDQYNSDITPLLQSESAGAQSSEKARQSKIALDLSQQVQSAQAQRAAAVSGAVTGAQQFNAGQQQNAQAQRLSIAQFNAQQKQQNDQVQAAAAQAALAQAAATSTDKRDYNLKVAALLSTAANNSEKNAILKQLGNSRIATTQRGQDISSADRQTAIAAANQRAADARSEREWQVQTQLQYNKWAKVYGAQNKGKTSAVPKVTYSNVYKGVQNSIAAYQDNNGNTDIAGMGGMNVLASKVGAIIYASNPNIKPGSAQYKALGYAILGSLRDKSGKPVKTKPGWFNGATFQKR